jgi:Domain of unknown function (DUF397)
MTVQGHWRKSSYSEDAGCVELTGDLNAVRDSKQPSGPVLAVDVRTFVAAIKRRELGN